MVKKVSIGVLAVQGAVSEHITAMRDTFKETNTSGEVFFINSKNDLKKIDALILPGGESTTISNILEKTGMYTVIQDRIKNNDLPIMGTCAGCVILAKELEDDDDKVKLLKVMDMQVTRNSFGRQRESFEKNITIEGFSEPYNAVFIRAPTIKRVWNGCKVLAKIDKEIVMARQDKFLALSFHPELTDDLRVHKYFLDMIV